MNARTRAERERRAAERYATTGLHAQLVIELESSVLTLSVKGMGVRLAFAPAIGSVHPFVLRFGPRVINVHGAVRNVVPDPATAGPSYVVGVEFQELTPADAAFLEQFVSRRLGESVF